MVKYHFMTALIVSAALSACSDNKMADSVAKPVTTTGSTTSSSSANALPDRIDLDVPFTPQAPTADWGDPYQEACEEASVIMAHHFLTGEDIGTPEAAEQKIMALVAWEMRNGFDQDVSIEQLADIVRRYYDHETRIIERPSVTDIERMVAQGLPVIVPAAGRELDNPYFSGEGPWYHMLIITGYDNEHFIVNDPGTKRGEGYQYDKQTLMHAIRDWAGHKTEIMSGTPRALVITLRNPS